MTDTPIPGAPTPEPRCDSQLVVALAIVAAMTVLGLAGIVACLVMKNAALAAVFGVGTIVGSLATALNTPTGISTALKAAKGSAQ